MQPNRSAGVYVNKIMKAGVFLCSLLIGIAAVTAGEFYRNGCERSAISAFKSDIPKGTSKDQIVKYLVAGSFTTRDDGDVWHPLINGVEVRGLWASKEYHSVWGTFYVVLTIYFDKETGGMIRSESNSFFPNRPSL